MPRLYKEWWNIKKNKKEEKNVNYDYTQKNNWIGHCMKLLMVPSLEELVNGKIGEEEKKVSNDWWDYAKSDMNKK